MSRNRQVARRPITVDDLANIITVEDPRISPDGEWIAYVHRQPDLFENTYIANIWLAPTDGGLPLQLTRSGKDTSPRWSPDGKWLAIVSKRSDQSQIYLLPTTSPGGEARALTSMKNGATDPEWSPDGAMIAFLSPVSEPERSTEPDEEGPPADKLEKRHREERQKHDEEQQSDPRRVWRIPYREGTSYLTERYKQVYVIDSDYPEAKPRRLTDIDANHRAPRWSPDGMFLYTSRPTEPNIDEPYRTAAIYKIEVETGKAERLTEDGFSHFEPKPSPDGRWLAFQRNPGSRYNLLPRLAVMDLTNGAVRDLNLDLDRAIDSFEWVDDGQHLVCSVSNEGTVQLYRVNVEIGEFEQTVGGRLTITGFDTHIDIGTAFVASTAASPTELFWVVPGADEPLQLTDVNTAFLGEVAVEPVNEVLYVLADGTRIQGWYLLPSDYEEGRQYPLIVYIHGGPHYMWGPAIPSTWHELQVLAASGYVVFFCNPRGSDGYGADFRDAIHANWGNADMGDIMAGIDVLIGEGFIDAARIGITGGSYGGFMTTWIIAHSNRFKAAVAQRGVYNHTSFYGTSDIPSFMSDEFDGDPWEIHDKLWKHSPLAYAHKIKTPLLLIHSDNDFRVPIEQAEQMFASVRRSGGTVELLRYPRDGHELSRSGEPKHRVDRLEKIKQWFDWYLKPNK